MNEFYLFFTFCFVLFLTRPETDEPNKDDPLHLDFAWSVPIPVSEVALWKAYAAGIWGFLKWKVN